MNTFVILDEREEENRYAAYLEGQCIGRASAIVVKETVLIPHVEVEPAKRDLGIGSPLLRRAFDDARTEGTPYWRCAPSRAAGSAGTRTTAMSPADQQQARYARSTPSWRPSAPCASFAQTP
jgi:predicted GNAT family acetyltransferase